MRHVLAALAAIAVVAFVAWAGTTVFDGSVTVTDDLTVTDDITITGDVAVTGSITGWSSEKVTVAAEMDSTCVVAGTFKALTASYFSKAVVCSSTVAVTGAITATAGVTGAVTGNVTGDLTGDTTGDANSGTVDVDTLDITGSAVGVGLPALPTASVHAGRFATNAAADTLYWSDGTNWQQVVP